jgi:hypothetical protein
MKKIMTGKTFFRFGVRFWILLLAGLCSVLGQYSEAYADGLNAEGSGDCQSDVFLRKARQAADRIAEQSERDYVLGEIAELLAKAGDFRNALQTSAAIEKQEIREYEVQKVALLQAESGDFSGARESAARLSGLKSYVLTEIAKVQAQKGDIQGALQAVKELGPDAREEIIGIQAMDQADSGNFSAAIATAAALQNKDDVLWAIAMGQATLGQIPEALKTGLRIQDPDMRRYVPSAVASVRAEAGDFEGALRIAKTLPSTEKVDIFLDIAAQQVKAGKLAEASSTFQEAIRSDLGDRDANRRREKLARIAAAQLQARISPTAIEEMEKLPEGHAKESAFYDLGVAERRAGDLQNALKYFERSKDSQACALIKGKLGDFDGALTALNAESNPGNVSNVIKEIAIARAERGDVAGAFKLVPRIRIRGNMDYEDAYQAEALRKIARVEVKTGDLSGALFWIEAQHAAYLQADSLLGVVEGILDRCPASAAIH